MKVGYARVSTDEQDLALQIDALHDARCDALFTDQGVSGAVFDRPGLDSALATLQPGDALVVWRLDRLGRSLSKLVELIERLNKRGVEFISLMESINTQSSGGVLVFHVLAALAEFEKRLISERTRAGLAAARARGQRLGRRHSLDPGQRQRALEMLQTCSLTEVAREFDVHTRTLKRLVQEHTASTESVEPIAPIDPSGETGGDRES
ncbi:recombinase family protein [Burkholderia vietnamiensis]|uniref:recombinase family protein n=1 Tax=Burkholderia vietnamiensis TaxID=60552 RepID=UPI001588E22E|nr:recombinase family protein [Burkholderia vietnamiensis]